ncbi:hypothetical protein AACH10_20390 [Ideonella sp. DXS22W]|uniref:Uncharacterized protein n=1 Tax=Pseudaquabacterium inlustre TaxID=2984192 RepID=A0ABU9CPJ8_9BURK
MTTRAVREIRTLQDIEQLERQPLEALIPSRNLYELLHANAALHGDRPALTVLGSGRVGDVLASFTHRALLGEVTRAVNLFTALGLGTGSVISILSRTHARVPALLPLVHEDAPTRMILLAGAGSFESAHITLTQGVHVDEADDAAEWLCDHLDAVSSRAGEVVPEQGWEQYRLELAKASFQPA